MNIHEYQARELFEKFGVATSKGQAATTAAEAVAIARELGAAKIVVKAQIHAGGRGKGTFTNGFKGGVHVCDTPEQAGEIAAKMLGQTLVTHQTGPEGKLVSKIIVAEAVDIERELYLAILLDRQTSAPVIIASTAGGMDIEEVAEHAPEKITREPVHPLLGLQAFQIRKLAKLLGLTGKLAGQAGKLFSAMYRLFIERDCSQIEVNPLVVTPDGRLLALDAKFNFDDNALYRQPEIVAMRDKSEEDPREVAASEFSLNYIGLDGNIACLVNGAGLAMATMDIIQYAGGSPANFLDVGGGASQEQVAAAFKIILADPKVQAIFINIFGGILRVDRLATGVVAAARNLHVKVPIVLRLEGTNVEEGRKIHEESGLNFLVGATMKEAAEMVVKAAASA